ncbi:MAG: hypothetical protein RLZZ369_497 [Pseudomonadota bacterium]
MMAIMAFHPHRRHALRPWLRRTIYVLMAALLLSGCLWLSVHFLAWPQMAQASMEGLPSPWESPLMKLHGGAMLGLVFLVGRLSGTHVLLGWRIKQRVWDGMALLVLLGILALSGYALYYWIPEAWRDALGLLHGGVGTLTVLGLWYHRRVSRSQGH